MEVFLMLKDGLCKLETKFWIQNVTSEALKRVQSFDLEYKRQALLLESKQMSMFEKVSI